MTSWCWNSMLFQFQDSLRNIRANGGGKNDNNNKKNKASRRISPPFIPWLRTAVPLSSLVRGQGSNCLHSLRLHCGRRFTPSSYTHSRSCSASYRHWEDSFSGSAERNFFSFVSFYFLLSSCVSFPAPLDDVLHGVVLQQACQVDVR